MRKKLAIVLAAALTFNSFGAFADELAFDDYEEDYSVEEVVEEEIAEEAEEDAVAEADADDVGLAIDEISNDDLFGEIVDEDAEDLAAYSENQTSDSKVKVTTTTNGSAYYDNLDEAVYDIIKAETQNATITLLADVTYTAKYSESDLVVDVPLTIDLGGKTLTGAELLVSADPTRGPSSKKVLYANGAICKKEEKTSDGELSKIVFAEHNYTTMYNWNYDATAAVGEQWEVVSVSEVCANCGTYKFNPDDQDSLPGGLKTGGASAWGTVLKTYYSESNGKGTYEFGIYNETTKSVDHYTSANWGLDWYASKTVDVETSGYRLTAGASIVKVGSVNQHSDGLPIVTATVIDIASEAEVTPQITVTAATDEEIEDAIEAGVITKGNTDADCMTMGAIVYKVVVAAPDGKVLQETYLRDEQATATTDHVAGPLYGYQLLKKSTTGEKSEAAARNVASKAKKPVIKITSESDGNDTLYFYWYWDTVTPVTNGTDTRNASLVGTKLEGLTENDYIDADGSFMYRPVYWCDYENYSQIENTEGKLPASKQIFGAAVTVEPYADAANNTQYNAAIAGTGNYSTCEDWNYPGIVIEYECSRTPGVPVKSNLTYTIDVDSVRKSMPTHVKATTYAVSTDPTCMEKGVASIICAICGEGVDSNGGSDGSLTVRVDKLPHTYGEAAPARAMTLKSVSGVTDFGKFEASHNVSYSADKTEATVSATCMEDGGIYKWCDGKNNVIADSESGEETPHGHWVKQETIKATGHQLATMVSIPDDNGYYGWNTVYYTNEENKELDADEVAAIKKAAITKAKDAGDDAVIVLDESSSDEDKELVYNEAYEKAYLNYLTQNLKEVSGDFGFNKNHDYTFTVRQACNNPGCNGADVTYHYMSGTDTELDKYSAITVVDQAEGSDCQTLPKTIYSVVGITDTWSREITKELVKEDGVVGPHVYEVVAWNWSADYKTATITGKCTVEGCTGHTADVLAATVTQETSEDGVTTFTATYGDKTDIKKVYTLIDAKVTYDTSAITDGNLVEENEGYSAAQVPDVTVTINGTVIDNSTITPTWKYGTVDSSTAVVVTVEWNDDIIDVASVDEKLDARAASDPYKVAAKEKFSGIDVAIKLNDEIVEKTVGTETSNKTEVTAGYDPSNSYEVIVSDTKVKKATVKYAISDKEITAKKADTLTLQEQIEALDYSLDEVAGLTNVGKYYVYAQVSADGYTTRTAYAGYVIITKKSAIVYVDNARVVEGEYPNLHMRAVGKDEDGNYTVELTIDPADFTITTVGGESLENLKAGTYRLMVTADNYSIITDTNTGYVATLEVLAKDDSTPEDQAKAESVTATINALGDNPTAEEVAAARAQYNALSDAAKARVDDETYKKLTDAEKAVADDAAEAAKKAAIEAANTAAGSAEGAAEAAAMTPNATTLKAAADAVAAAEKAIADAKAAGATDADLAEATKATAIAKADQAAAAAVADPSKANVDAANAAVAAAKAAGATDNELTTALKNQSAAAAANKDAVDKAVAAANAAAQKAASTGTKADVDAAQAAIDAAKKAGATDAQLADANKNLKAGQDKLAAATAKKNATVKASKSTVKKGKKATVKITSDSTGKITVTAKNKKAKNKKFVKIKKNGKVVFTKKAKKGTYKFTVKVAAAGNYKATTKVIKIKVK